MRRAVEVRTRTKINSHLSSTLPVKKTQTAAFLHVNTLYYTVLQFGFMHRVPCLTQLSDIMMANPTKLPLQAACEWQTHIHAHKYREDSWQLQGERQRWEERRWGALVFCSREQKDFGVGGYENSEHGWLSLPKVQKSVFVCAYLCICVRRNERGVVNWQKDTSQENRSIVCFPGKNKNKKSRV